MAFTPAVELSYLTEDEQHSLLETIRSEDCTPSLSEAQQMKKLSQEGKLDVDTVFKLLTTPKANQKEKVSLPVDDIRKYFPKDATVKQIQEAILSLIKAEYERQRRKRSRDAR